MLGATAFIGAQSPAPKPADELFRAIPQAANIRDYMQRLSARPHHVGSAYTRTTPSGCWRSSRSGAGTRAIEHFDVLFPTPKERVLELVEPTKFTAKLEEPVVSVDPDVRPEDRTAAVLQRVLDRRRRHGAARLRQLRPRRGLRRARAPGHLGARRDRHRALRRDLSRRQAEDRGEHGAVGCLIYSDPKDDGFAQGAVFPNGPMRPSDGVQRGAVEDLRQRRGRSADAGRRLRCPAPAVRRSTKRRC